MLPALGPPWREVPADLRVRTSQLVGHLQSCGSRRRSAPTHHRSPPSSQVPGEAPAREQRPGSPDREHAGIAAGGPEYALNLLDETASLRLAPIVFEESEQHLEGLRDRDRHPIRHRCRGPDERRRAQDGLQGSARVARAQARRRIDREGDRVLAARAQLVDRLEARQCLPAPRQGLRETPHAYEGQRDGEVGVGTYLEVAAPQRGL